MAIIWLLIIVGILTYLWLKRTYNFWNRNGVPGPKPIYFLGNVGSVLSFFKHLGDVTSDWYNRFRDEPYIGYYKLTTPAILLRDVDLIKKVFIDNFDSFSENGYVLNEDSDPLMVMNPFYISDVEWEEARKVFAPVFTTKNTKAIVPVMNGVGKELVNYIQSHPPNTEFEAKSLVSRFTIQNVFKCSFSIEPGCFDIDQDSEYLEAFRKMYASSFWLGLKWIFVVLLPKWVTDVIPLQFTPNETDRLFRQVVNSNIASRPHGTQRNDILQIFLKVRESFGFTDTSMAGYLFSLAWKCADTTSSAFSFALYELARNPHCQEILHDEINEILNLYDGLFTNEALEDMIYLEAVLYEVFRMHPAATVLGKRCTKRFRLPRNNHQSKPFMIYPGTPVTIPVIAIHMDPRYYPNPEKFEPERFLPEERQRRHKGTYLGFGEGPRICPAINFAMVQMKIALVHLIKTSRINLSMNQKEIVIDPKTYITNAKNGILLKFVPR